jgi:aromatic ring-opening dioxygenase catalytic subunit (LigB family)
MGKIVYAAAMSHVLAPDYYGKNVGPHGRKMVEELIDVVRDMGRTMLAARPDALVVIADDHLNVFSFDAVPAMCVRIGRFVERMVQADAIEFDRALDGLPERYPLHEDLANRILERGLEDGFDFAASWSAPLDHAFLSPVSTLCGDRPAPPLVPFWVNCFVAPLPMARRCFAAGRHIARVVAEGPWDVAVIATGGLSHFPELSLARVGTSDAAFDRRIVRLLEAGDHEALCALTTKELHESGSHELLNWMVLIGAVSPAKAAGSLLRRDGAHRPRRHGVERAMSRYDVNVILYKLKKDAAFRTRFQVSPRAVLAGADLSDEEVEAFVRWDTRRLNELGGSLHLLVSIPHLGGH